MITLDLSILNQKGTPMFNSDIFANRPAAGVVGRIFISTDTYAIYRDTGSAWDQIGGSGSGITGSGTAGTLPIWTSSSALGDSSLLEGASKISTIKDIQADGYYLTGMTLGTGALYYNSAPEDRVTLANYNVGGTVYIEVNGGTYAAKWGSDLSLTNYGYIAATPTLTAANNASSLASFGINTLSYAAGFSSNNIGALYGGMAGFNLQTFAGSATFAQANVASGGASVNSIDFSSAGSTITMTQSSGIRVMSGQQNLFQYQGTNSGTITHAAISQNTGFYRPSGASGTLTITNAYSHLINALDDYGAGFTFTNRWGIYQAGASDNNYFASKVLIGSTTDIGVSKLQVTGNGNFTGSVSATGLFGYILRGRSSDNFGAFGFYSNDGLTRYGYIQSGSTNGGQLNITADGGSQLIMDSRGNIFNNGKVGIATGATAPSSFLQIKGGSGNQLTLDNSGERFTQVSFLNNSSSSKGAIWFDNTNSLFELYCGSGISQTFYANGSEAARISNAQNFLIGTSIDLGYKALISGNTNIVGSLYLNQVEFAASDGAANYIKTGTQLYFQSTTATIATLSNLGALTLQSSLTINGFFRVNGQSSATAGGSSGQHLIINLDGTTYKIALLNP